MRGIPSPTTASGGRSQVQHRRVRGVTSGRSLTRVRCVGHRGHVTASACPSCGWNSTTGTDGIEPPFRASPACYSAYLELSAYNVGRARWDFLHQEAVDAYAAQHPGPPAKPISVWFALVGLHLALDQGRTGRQVQRAHMQLGRYKRLWSPLRPPADLRCMTAGEALRHSPGDDRDAAILRWAGDVWSRWADSHLLIAELCTDRGL
jgi:hypothetical protein